MTSNVEESDIQLHFRDLEEQMIQFVDHCDMEEMLKLQLSELEMLQSMYPNHGEFCVDDQSVIADINEYVDGRKTELPLQLDFTINLQLEKGKLEVCINLPHDYPAAEPDIYVRSNKLSRTHQHTLNSNLAAFVADLNRGEICIGSALEWLRDNALFYMDVADEAEHCAALATDDKESNFVRYWIYSHHIYSKSKRKEMSDLAKEYDITGFCLPGRPGIICAEGLAGNCDLWWQKVKCMSWKKIMCKKKEVEALEDSKTIDSFRKFPNFEEIVFDGAKGRGQDMGCLFRYLEDHQCGYVFKEYFGVDGKISTNHC